VSGSEFSLGRGITAGQERRSSTSSSTILSRYRTRGREMWTREEEDASRVTTRSLLDTMPFERSSLLTSKSLFASSDAPFAECRERRDKRRDVTRISEPSSDCRDKEHFFFYGIAPAREEMRELPLKFSREMSANAASGELLRFHTRPYRKSIEFRAREI